MKTLLCNKRKQYVGYIYKYNTYLYDIVKTVFVIFSFIVSALTIISIKK